MPPFKTILAMVFDKGLKIALILALSFLVYEIGIFFLRRAISLRIPFKKGEPRSAEVVAAQKRASTLSTLLQSTLKYVLFFLAGYLLLEVLLGRGRLLPVLAGAGVVGLALGLGAQNLIKDVVSGFFILFEGWYAVGDFVHIKAGSFEAQGLVEEVGLRTTTVRDLEGNLHYIPNGAILGVDKYPQGYLTYNLELILPKLPEEKIRKSLEKLGEDLPQPPFVLSAFKSPAIAPYGEDKVLVRTSAHFIPLSEEKAKEIAHRFVEELKKLLAVEKIPFSIYSLDPKVLRRYKKSISLR